MALLDYKLLTCGIGCKETQDILVAGVYVLNA